MITRDLLFLLKIEVYFELIDHFASSEKVDGKIFPLFSSFFFSISNENKPKKDLTLTACNLPKLVFAVYVNLLLHVVLPSVLQLENFTLPPFFPPVFCPFLSFFFLLKKCKQKFERYIGKQITHTNPEKTHFLLLFQTSSSRKMKMLPKEEHAKE